MATRRTKKRHAGPEGGPETAEQMLDRVLGAFDRWLAGRESDRQRHTEVTEIVRTACELKSSYLGESNPADWSPQTTVEVLGRVFPRKVVGVDDSYVSALVPAMLTYVEFLVLTGRWKPQNDASATRSALTALDDDLPGRFNDPDRLSMAGRLMQLATDEGVDITEPDALEGFMERFNDMPYEWRKRLTDGPGMLPDFPEDLGFDDPGLWQEPLGDDDAPGAFDNPDVTEHLRAAIATGTAAIGFVAHESVLITVPDARSELATILGTPLLTRLSALAVDPAAPTTILVTHHVEEIPIAFSHVLLLRAGRVLAAGPIGDTLTAANLSETFGMTLTLQTRGGRFFAYRD